MGRRFPNAAASSVGQRQVTRAGSFGEEREQERKKSRARGGDSRTKLDGIWESHHTDFIHNSYIRGQNTVKVLQGKGKQASEQSGAQIGEKTVGVEGREGIWPGLQVNEIGNKTK